MASAVIESGKVPLIYAKVQAIREQVGAVRKEGAGGVPYNFRGIDQVTNAIYPALNEHGVIIYPTGADRTLTQRLVGGQEKNGVLVGQKLMSTSDITLRLRAVAVEDGSYIDIEVAGESQDYSDKSTAQAHSVAYRIAILQTFTLPTDAPDPELNQEKPGGVEDVVGTAPAVKPLQDKLKEWINTQTVTHPVSGEVSDVTSLEVNAVAERLVGDATKFKTNKWKSDPTTLAAVVAEIESGARK